MNRAKLDDGHLVFHCPGCKTAHSVPVGPARGPHQWGWNGSLEQPTLDPSVQVLDRDHSSRCHFFLSNGQFQFQADCKHPLASQLVDAPEWSA